MSDRYTSKDATRAFVRLCSILGKRIATTYNDVGAWQLDHNSIYGGYVIEEINCDAGSITHPLGDSRYPAREFFDRCYFAGLAVGIARKGATNV